MNQTDRAELDRCRQKMWELFQSVVRVEYRTEIEGFIEAMDRHQEILSKDGQEIAE